MSPPRPVVLSRTQVATPAGDSDILNGEPPE